MTITPLNLNLSGIVDDEQIDASDVTTPFNQAQVFVNALAVAIDSNATAIGTEATNRAAADTAITTEITNLVDGVKTVNQLNFGGYGTKLTISSDAISITKSRHQIDTQGGAATDDLSTINGFAAGDMLFLQTTSASRVVTIKHGVDNIFVFTLSDIILDHPSKIAIFVYDLVTEKWCSTGNTQPSLLLRETLNNTQVSMPLLTVPDRSLVPSGYGSPRLDVVPGITTSHRVTVRASGATIQSDLGAITVSGVPSASNQVESSYSSIPTVAAALASPAGFVSTFDQLQRRYNPWMETIVRTPSTFVAARWFIGFMAAAPGNADDPAAGFIGLRYSSVGPDLGWKIVMDDGSTMTVHGVDLAAYSADTPYLFRIRVDGSGGGVAYFSVNNGAEIAVTLGMIGAAVNMGFGCIAYTNAAVSKNILFRSMVVGWA